MTDLELSASVIRQIQDALFGWYERNRRDLAWRRDPDPYATFVSEIMLQQTGVERVQPAFTRFINAFPNFECLANAPKVEVLRAWAGLGYNRRAIRLQECARVICREFGGVLPSNAKDLARLPGVGSYTVAAIQSFVFGEDVAALDTNIRRVVSRVWFGAPVTDREIRVAATRLLPVGRGAEWNQALMDFGSLQCTADRPACVICPLRDCCRAIARSSVASVPRRIAEKPEPYRGSRRYIRGRIVAFLRDLQSNESVPIGDLEQTLIAAEIAIDRDSLQTLLRALADEGLCQVIDCSEGMTVGPPR